MSLYNECAQWHSATVLESVRGNLEKRGFTAVVLPDAAALTAYLEERVPVTASVGLGGSVTLRQLELDTLFARRGNTVFDHWDKSLKPEEVMVVRRQQLQCDWFFTSLNAVTLDGQLVNTDGMGNRVAAMTFGPRQVVAVVGFNKIVRHLDEAMWRVQNVAAPQNCRRLGLSTPCSRTARCGDCGAATSTCRVSAVFHYRPTATPFTVLLLPQTLGF